MNANGSNPWALELFGAPPGAGIRQYGRTLFPDPTNPAITGWFENWFPKPAPPQPMERGKPQEPASGWGTMGTAEAIAGRVGEGISQGIEGAVDRTLGRFFAPDRMRDATVYLGAALLLVIAVWSMLR